jgi:hypothetical protein
MKELLVALLIVLAIGVIIFTPLACIWSLNVLFPVLSIPYTLNTWLAAFFFTSLFGSGAVAKVSK